MSDFYKRNRLDVWYWVGSIIVLAGYIASDVLLGAPFWVLLIGMTPVWFWFARENVKEVAKDFDRE